ncbi:putative heavy metal-associated domain protein [Streptomyces himastatinicus ATCC 53653]|uniref:Putative heavy metal-associated domain protein n=1 Tax=Streptomyces himastatinicus ATCC 53653 TaxID=457427 RepID=D9WFX9_9ACTN|nr:heavy-metal-associated domain-containing protein [Streptomyces himastatinicus]EFL21215.1 putative heavy metal-associated domain protein [Streptomyces himastatinicus ATCC 53653]
MSDCCTPDGSCHTSESKTVYQVNGVGSAHCQGIVTKAVEALDDVKAVEVEIGTGLVTVTTSAKPDEALDKLIAKAVDEAGYDFAGRVDG